MLRLYSDWILLRTQGHDVVTCQSQGSQANLILILQYIRGAVPDHFMPGSLWNPSIHYFTLIRDWIGKSASSGSIVGSPPSWMCPENLQREASRRLTNQMPEPLQLAAFIRKKQWLYSELPPDVQTSHPNSEATQPPKGGK